MNIYTPENLPKRGRAKLLWNTLTASGIELADLHYNANLWGRGGDRGYGTWAFEGMRGGIKVAAWCGQREDGMVYVMATSAPYGGYLLTPTI